MAEIARNRAGDADVGDRISFEVAADTIADNLTPVGRIYYNGSTLLCLSNAMSQAGGYALGAQAGEAAVKKSAAAAGFIRFRRAAETSFNLIYEARP
jgi:hypothetical protein